LRAIFLRLAIALLAAAPCASAQALQVQVDAPDDLKPLLEQYLETARAVRLGEALTEDELVRLQQASLKTAHELLATEGYFSPQISTSITRAGDEPVVHYAVQAGARSLIDAVNIRFAGEIAKQSEEASAQAESRTRRRNQRERIERDFVLKPGMPFRQADWTAAKATALRPLHRSRFPAARLASSEAKIDPATQRATLTLVIDSGPAFYYGALQISGNQRYADSTIRALSPVAPGEPYRQQDIVDYQRLLDASGYFSQVVVRVEPDPAQAAAVPIQVVVSERKEKRVSFGVGYSTDNGARVQAEYLDRVVGDDLRLKLAGRLESSEQYALAELAWPRSARGYENRVAISFEQKDIEGQNTAAWESVASRHRKRDHVDATLSVQFQTEQQTLGAAPSLHNQALSLNYAWTYRTDGRAFYPTRGFVTTLQAGVASDALLSDTSFIRLAGRHTQFFKLGEAGRLILRGELGNVIADRREGIPTAFLFRAGGANSVRGYAFESLGLNVNGAVQSVRNLATASVEYNHFFTPNWGGAVFVDAGDAADSVDELSAKVGVGFGVRYKSPIGPINLDLAYGEAIDDFRLHFALGVAF
jgi:translocation and assembly module TamA